MKIVKQELPYECGICCLKMLIDHYFKHNNISKHNLINNTSIDKDGISILNLELLALDFNIYLESYFSEWEEIFNLKPKNPFILIMKTNNLLHYVVGIYKSNKIFIYDPNGNISSYDKSNPPIEFANIFISSNTSYIKQNKINIQKNSWMQMPMFYTIIMLLFVIITFAINTSFNFFVSKILDILNKNDNTILFSISVWMILFLFFQYLSNYLIFAIEQWYNKKVYYYNLIYFKRILINKTNNFYKLIDSNEFLFFYQILKQYIIFWNNFYISIFKGIIISIASIIIISILNYELLYFALPLIFVNVILNITLNKLEYKHNKNNINITNNITYALNIIKIYSEFNYDFNLIEKNIEESIIKIRNLEHNTISNNKKSFHINSLIKISSNLINLFVFMYVIINYTNKELSKLTIYLALLSMLQDNFNNFISTLLDINNFKLVNNILKNLISINNIKTNENNINCYGVQSLKINGEDIITGHKIINHNFDLFQYFEENEIYINQIKLKDYNHNSIKKIVKYISKPNIDNYINNIYDARLYIDKSFYSIYLNLLNNYKIESFSNISNQILIFIINLLLMTKFRSKLIFIEVYISYCTDIELNQLIDSILTFLVKENMVIFINNNLLDNEKNNNYIN